MTHYRPRSTAMQAAYDEFARSVQDDTFSFVPEDIKREFTHWVIIENRFPYDNMVRTNHLLVSKEPIVSLTEAPMTIKTEYEEIIQLLIDENAYDALIQNFPKTTTVKAQYHVHLVEWHNSG